MGNKSKIKKGEIMDNFTQIHSRESSTAAGTTSVTISGTVIQNFVIEKINFGIFLFDTVALTAVNYTTVLCSINYNQSAITGLTRSNVLNAHFDYGSTKNIDGPMFYGVGSIFSIGFFPYGTTSFNINTRLHYNFTIYYRNITNGEQI